MGILLPRLNDRQPDDANAQQLAAYLARMKSVFVG